MKLTSRHPLGDAATPGSVLPRSFNVVSPGEDGLPPAKAFAQTVPRSRKAVVYAWVGVALAGGAPFGWLLFQAANASAIRGDLLAELRSNASLYGYLFVGTALAFGVFGYVVGTLADRLARVNFFLKNLAITDALTSLKNDRYFSQRLRAEAARARRENRGLALILVDLDWFKRINDRYGHAMGNLVLQEVARRFTISTRTMDVVCRIGGEEFAVICPGAGAQQATAIAERMRCALANHAVAFVGGAEVMTASFGVAVLGPTDSPDSLFTATDAALYDAKRSGRNRVVLHDPDKRAMDPGSSTLSRSVIVTIPNSSPC